MRKHHTRWVALFSAAAISTSGLVGLAGPAAADDKEAEALSWPVVSQGVSSYNIDGYQIAYLPPGLDRYGINAGSTTDRQGNSRSQLSWVQGPDRLYGRVAVLRSENLQELDDLRGGRYSHLADSSLEELPENEAFEHGAYLAEETGDLFWLASPGVAVTTHLQPDRWESDELIRMAESISQATETGGTEEVEEAETDEAPEDEAPEGEAPTDEAPEDDAPADEEAHEESPAGDVTPKTPEGETPEENVIDEAPAEEEEAVDEVPVDEVSNETPVEDAEEAQEADLPQAPTAREAKTCLVEHFVDFETGSTDLDQEQMAPSSQEFVEQTVNEGDLDDAELDRLLATVWYYGDEADKVAATGACAKGLGMERDEVEDAVTEVSELIGELVEEANEAMADAMDEVEQASSGAGEAAVVEDPVDAEEWEELWDSLPWSIPAENS